MSLTINGSGGGTPTGTPNVETGSYVGDGSYTQSITFDKNPVFVIVSKANGSFGFFMTTKLTDSYQSASYQAGGSYHGSASAKLDGKTLSWQTNSSCFYEYGFNSSNVTYYYFAITI